MYFLIIVRIIRQVKRRVSTEMNSLRKHLYNSSINNQEKSTIRNCALVTSSFILCTYPLAADLLRGRPCLIPYLFGILLTLSRCLNPVIYFFANHIQRWYVYVSVCLLYVYAKMACLWYVYVLPPSQLKVLNFQACGWRLIT